MSRRAAACLAWKLAAVSLLIMALGLLLIFLGWSTPLPRGWHPWAYQAIDAVGLIGAPILGGLIASRRPENPYGWLWIGFGLGFALVSIAQDYACGEVGIDEADLRMTLQRVVAFGLLSDELLMGGHHYYASTPAFAKLMSFLELGA